MLEQKLITLINEKANKECGSTALLSASHFIEELEKHITGDCTLSEQVISNKVDYLAGCLTITLDVGVTELELLRTRCSNDLHFKNVDEVSYIKSPTSTFPPLGRLNKPGQVIYYAAVKVRQDDTALRVVLSESNARTLDTFHVLSSEQQKKTNINLRIVGIWDLVRRDCKPSYLSEDTFLYYKEVYKLMKCKFSPELLMAYELTDRFFNDLYSRKGSNCLYQVTSEISTLLLDSEISDGILYSSVQAKDEPLIALKPKTVDQKITHKWVSEVEVKRKLGYEYYLYNTNNGPAKVEKSTGRINW